MIYRRRSCIAVVEGLSKCPKSRADCCRHNSRTAQRNEAGAAGARTVTAVCAARRAPGSPSRLRVYSGCPQHSNITSRQENEWRERIFEGAQKYCLADFAIGIEANWI